VSVTISGVLSIRATALVPIAIASSTDTVLAGDEATLVSGPQFPPSALPLHLSDDAVIRPHRLEGILSIAVSARA